MTRIITVTSGAAGVGKTSLAITLAAQLAAAGQRVCLLDADAGEACAHRLRGLEPEATLQQLLLGEATLEQVLARDARGFDILAGSPGSGWPQQLSTAQQLCLADMFHALADYDLILIDAASAPVAAVQALRLAAAELLLLITPRPESLNAAYKLLRQLYSGHYVGHICIAVNQARNHTVGRHTYDKFREVADFYLGAELPLAGILGEVSEAQDSESLMADPDFAGATRQLAVHLLETVAAVDMQDFISRYLQAAGVEECETAGALASTPDTPPGAPDLQRQLDGLSLQVDRLIEANRRLQHRGGASGSELYRLPRSGRRRQPEPCEDVCVAIDTRTEEVTVQGETFSIYHMPRSNGDPQRFACHSLDDDLQEPESRHSSP